MLVLTGNAAEDDPSQPANSCAVLSRVCPSYAPAGKHLVSVSAVSEAAPRNTAALVTAVREQLAGWFGASARVDRWRLLRVYDVPHAQPPQHLAQPAPMPLRVASGVYCCGDHMDCPSLNGALRSGRLAAEAILDCKMTIDNDCDRCCVITSCHATCTMYMMMYDVHVHDDIRKDSRILLQRPETDLCPICPGFEPQNSTSGR